MDHLQGIEPTSTQKRVPAGRSSRGLSESCAIQLSKIGLHPSLFPQEKADGESSLVQVGSQTTKSGGAVPCSNDNMGDAKSPVNPLGGRPLLAQFQGLGPAGWSRVSSWAAPRAPSGAPAVKRRASISCSDGR